MTYMCHLITIIYSTLGTWINKKTLQFITLDYKAKLTLQLYDSLKLDEDFEGLLSMAAGTSFHTKLELE